MARQYFEGGFYREAVVETRCAIAMNPNLADAHFDLGIFYMVLGEMDLTDQSFVKAVGLFGKAQATIDRIKSMMGQSVEVTACKRVLRDHFGVANP